jgi:hypothetical protein
MASFIDMSGTRFGMVSEAMAVFVPEEAEISLVADDTPQLDFRLQRTE